jgi:hypothetical protein
MLHCTSERESGGHGSCYQLSKRIAGDRGSHSDPGDFRPSRSGVAGIAGGLIVTLASGVDGRLMMYVV